MCDYVMNTSHHETFLSRSLQWFLLPNTWLLILLSSCNSTVHTREQIFTQNTSRDVVTVLAAGAVWRSRWLLLIFRPQICPKNRRFGDSFVETSFLMNENHFNMVFSKLVYRLDICLVYETPSRSKGQCHKVTLRVGTKTLHYML